MSALVGLGVARLFGLAITLLAALGMLGLTGCSPPPAAPPVTVCATQDVPPIVAPDEECPGPNRQVYSAPAREVDEDDWPVIGEPLDGDFWNPADQLDLDESHRSGQHHARPRTATRTSTIVVTPATPPANLDQITRTSAPKATPAPRATPKATRSSSTRSTRR